MAKKYSRHYLAAAVSLFTFLVYLAALRNDFVNWDDHQYLLENPHILSFDPTFLKWAFFDFYASNWHPLTWMSHALDHALWGRDPLGHHLTSNILHAMNTFLVVLLVVRLMQAAADERSPLPQETGDCKSRDARFILIAAGTTGLLFGLHPIHVESVAWVSERKDLLCALFYLLTIMTYLKYASATLLRPRGERARWYLLAVCFFILALMSKPMAVSLPAVLLILDWYPLNRILPLKRLWIAFLEKLPLIALSLLSSILTIVAQRSSGALQSEENYPLSLRVFVAAKSLFAYLGNMLLPVDLNPFYPYPEDISSLSFKYLLVIALPVLFTAACVVIAKRQKLLPSVWGYYLVTLIPVLGIVQVGGQSMADRYSYLPSLGPFLMIGLGVAWASQRADAMEKRGLLFKVVSASFAIVAVISLTYLTLKQIPVWRNSVDLWSAVIEKEPKKVPRAYINRSDAFCDLGRYDRAMADYDTLIAIAPQDPDGFFGKGFVYSKMGQDEKAIFYYDIAINLRQDDDEGYFGLDFFLLERGLAFLRSGQHELALDDLKKSCELGNDEGCRSLRKYEVVGGKH